MALDQLNQHLNDLGVGRCLNLEALWCMYCRDTGDGTTDHIAGLSQLKTYYAGKTNITDRSLETLGRMVSLEPPNSGNVLALPRQA